MKNIRRPAIIAIIGEAVLLVANALAGTFSIIEGANTNILGTAAVLFHAPGILLAGLLFGPLWEQRGGWNHPALAFVAVTGVVQFFLLTWAIIALSKRLKRHIEA